MLLQQLYNADADGVEMGLSHKMAIIRPGSVNVTVYTESLPQNEGSVLPRDRHQSRTRRH